MTMKTATYLGAVSFAARAAGVRVCIKPGTARTWETKPSLCFVPVIHRSARDHEGERG